MVWSCAFLLILILGLGALFSWLRGNPHSYPGPSQQHFSSGGDDRLFTTAALSVGHHAHNSDWGSGGSDSDWDSYGFESDIGEESSEASS
ncbi:MAG: hypothetical protein OHK0022_56030 [Roseiflexaceae bacterium]